VNKIKIIHAVDEKPKIEYEASVYAREGSYYVIPANQKYTIEKTSEQKQLYIESLEKQLSLAETKIEKILELLDKD
jgi:hypothetical protein